MPSRNPSCGYCEVADCLADERRRTVLVVLEERGSISRRGLASAVAEREVPGEPKPDAVEEVLIALHHVHLPRLAAAGLLEYDSETERVISGDEGAVDSMLSSSSGD